MIVLQLTLQIYGPTPIPTQWTHPKNFSKFLQIPRPTIAKVGWASWQCQCCTMYSVSQTEIFWHFFQNGWEFLAQILLVYCAHSYLRWTTIFLFNYLQLWRSYAIFSATTIMCSKCPPSVETHVGWSHLIWHNFVRVGDNWIKICIPAYVWTFNRRIKVGLKIPNCLG